MSDDERKIGIIVKFISQKGYGFIEDEFDRKDYFFHINELPQGILPEEGDKFSFVPSLSKYGKTQAKNLQPMKSGMF